MLIQMLYPKQEIMLQQHILMIALTDFYQLHTAMARRFLISMIHLTTELKRHIPMAMLRIMCTMQNISLKKLS